jgi:hypothetical protein
MAACNGATLGLGFKTNRYFDCDIYPWPTCYWQKNSAVTIWKIMFFLAEPPTGLKGGW